VLESHIRTRRQERDILLMTHIVLGYPSLADSLRLIATMVAAGVDLMELQIPFSEPIADGPVILKTNQAALERGTTVAQCFDVARQAAARFPIPFLFTSYGNILFKYGLDRFAADTAAAGLAGAIVPDIPLEEGDAYLAAMAAYGLAPVFIFAPNSSDARMRAIAAHARGFVYCVARKGVTGQQTDFSADLTTYLAHCRAATSLPLAVGFGVKDRADVEFLAGKADIAVIGSQTLRILDEQGIDAVGDFIRSLRG